jgi:UDP-glucose 4-epimerase
MRILITGGAGFIGSHLADQWLSLGAEVTVVDNLSTGRRENLEHLRGFSGFRFIEGSVLDRGLMAQLISDHDIVCHLAAVVGVRRVLSDPLQCVLQNVGGAEVVLALAYQYHRRVVFASTSEIYGKGLRVPFAEDDVSVLGSTNVARWSYAASKIVDEHLCFAYSAQGLPVSIVRYFNAYGPRLDPTGYGSVVATFVEQALSGEPLTVHGDGCQTRCFTYVDDAVRATVAAAQSQQALGEAFNVGANTEVSINDLAQMVLHLTGSRAGLTHVPYAQAYAAGFEDTPRRVPDTSKARRSLGFDSQISLQEGLQRTIDWFSNRKTAEARTR